MLKTAVQKPCGLVSSVGGGGGVRIKGFGAAQRQHEGYDKSRRKVYRIVGIKLVNLRRNS
jgi:hypothetical protein